MGRDWGDFHLGNRIIVFHDIAPGSIECVGEVPKFWKEIKDQYDNREIVEDWAQGGYGIGVLFFCEYF
ncbi:MAG: hypothetical protein QXO33_03065 [Nitrososphaeria archaeon]